MQNCYILHRICRIATFFTGNAEWLHSSQDMQNCFVIHRKCRIATFFIGYAELLHSSQDMQKCYVLHRKCRKATFFTGYAELLRVYTYVPVMHSPQDVVQDTELQFSSAENRRGAFGHSYLPRKSVHRRGLHCTRKYFSKLQIYKIAKT